MTRTASTAGVDVGKRSLDIGFDPTGKLVRHENEADGITKLVASAQKTLRAVTIDAIGPHAQRLVAGLTAAGVAVSIVDPRRIRAFRTAEGRTAKTDHLAARLIARFAHVVGSPCAPPPAPTRSPKALSTRRRQLTGLIADESAGKRCSTRLREGAPWLRTMLIQCAWAGARKKGSDLQAQFGRLRHRRGSKKAICAAAASILTAAFHRLRDGTTYVDLGADHFNRSSPHTQANRLAREIEKLGFSCLLPPATKEGVSIGIQSRPRTTPDPPFAFSGPCASFPCPWCRRSRSRVAGDPDRSWAVKPVGGGIVGSGAGGVGQA